MDTQAQSDEVTQPKVTQSPGRDQASIQTQQVPSCHFYVHCTLQHPSSHPSILPALPLLKSQLISPFLYRGASNHQLECTPPLHLACANFIAESSLVSCSFFRGRVLQVCQSLCLLQCCSYWFLPPTRCTKQVLDQ